MKITKNILLPVEIHINESCPIACGSKCKHHVADFCILRPNKEQLLYSETLFLYRRTEFCMNNFTESEAQDG